MTMTLTVRDETTAGETTNEFTLDFLTEKITVRELIRSRVFQEVKDYNARKSATQFTGLVQPTAQEERLNTGATTRSTGGRRDKSVDWERQYAVALEAFEQSRILVLVDDRQADSLDDPITVKPDTRVTFLKLVPLVGG